MKMEKEKPKSSFIESICVLPFDKGLYMMHFPRDVEIPKYDKNNGMGIHMITLGNYMHLIWISYMCTHTL